ncbi:hypothetical protein LCGC14_0606580 [marine sediment metagenome]|uniref:DNA mismatch repair protein MutS core domain-containing protein n=1 Tax=marine sediment metagenome TaxID=412755 RepID=A0A0F9UHF5_9ZZZZ|nr:hypothetical protein [bacterium]
MTKRELLDTLMYGMIVHSNKVKRKLVRQWMKDPILFSMIKQEFSAILADLLKIIRYVKNLNDEVIKVLE